MPHARVEVVLQRVARRIGPELVIFVDRIAVEGPAEDREIRAPLRTRQEHDVIAAGRAAFNSLRIEKGYRSWGTDMTTEHNPYEAGLGFAVSAKKPDFVGHNALQGISDSTIERRLTTVVIDDGVSVVMGNEPVFLDDKPVGYVTSAAFGHTVGAPVAYAWLPADTGEGTQIEIQLKTA